MSLGSITALNSWVKFQNPEKCKQFTEVIQDSKEYFTEFLQRLTRGVRAVSDQEIRQVIIDLLAFKNCILLRKNNSAFKSQISTPRILDLSHIQYLVS